MSVTPQVKPLEWHQGHDGGGWMHQVWVADCPIFEKRFYAESESMVTKIEKKRADRILSAIDQNGGERMSVNEANLAASDARIQAAVRAGMIAAANDVSSNAWKHEGDDSYSQGMDYGARNQNEIDHASILALAADSAAVARIAKEVAP